MWHTHIFIRTTLRYCSRSTIINAWKTSIWILGLASIHVVIIIKSFLACLLVYNIWFYKCSSIKTRLIDIAIHIKLIKCIKFMFSLQYSYVFPIIFPSQEDLRRLCPSSHDKNAFSIKMNVQLCVFTKPKLHLLSHLVLISLLTSYSGVRKFLISKKERVVDWEKIGAFQLQNFA